MLAVSGALQLLEVVLSLWDEALNFSSEAKHMRKFHQLLSLLLLVLFGSNLLFAQATASGSIQGTVYDKSQAIVVGAQVTATNQATGASRTSTSSDSGGFRFDLLPAGKYSVRVSKSGFATLSQNVELLVGQTASANAILTPGS